MSIRPSAGATARALYAGQLTPARLVATLNSADTLFPVARVARGHRASDLPRAPAQLENLVIDAVARRYDLVEYLAYNRTAGLLVLKDGAIVREDYELGLAPDDRWASFSLAKSICSTLYGAARRDGLIGALDQSVARYLPSLADSAYAEVSIAQLLQMTSGVQWREAYLDPTSERRRFLECHLEGRAGALLQMMRTLPRAHSPGAAFNYNTGETYLAGAVLEAALGGSLAGYLSQKIWSPAGMQADALWWLESAHGGVVGGSGLCATLRDYARYARFVLDDGCIGATRVVAEGWLQESTAPRDRAGRPRDYGYQWWPLPSADPLHAGAFLAMGIFGQRMYLNPRTRLAIVVLSARPKPSDAHVVEDVALYAAVARALG